MPSKEETTIESLCFYVAMQDSNTKKLVIRDLFDCSRIRESVALWVANGEEFQNEHDFLSWCFSDVRARCEYEMVVVPWPCEDDELVGRRGKKVDIYELYCKPNETLLRAMVDKVSVSSAKGYLKKVRKNENTK